jgi:periplasmic divalent cation tolerance protein
MEITIFYIPTGSEEEALAIGRMAIEQKLAACANVFPIRSMYVWDATMQEDAEYVLLLKTIPALTSRLSTFAEENHSYTTPCIIHWDVQVNPKYREWIKSQVAE